MSNWNLIALTVIVSLPSKLAMVTLWSPSALQLPVIIVEILWHCFITFSICHSLFCQLQGINHCQRWDLRFLERLCCYFWPTFPSIAATRALLLCSSSQNAPTRLWVSSLAPKSVCLVILHLLEPQRVWKVVVMLSVRCFSLCYGNRVFPWPSSTPCCWIGSMTDSQSGWLPWQPFFDNLLFTCQPQPQPHNKRLPWQF